MNSECHGKHRWALGNMGSGQEYEGLTWNGERFSLEFIQELCFYYFHFLEIRSMV